MLIYCSCRACPCHAPHQYLILAEGPMKKIVFKRFVPDLAPARGAVTGLDHCQTMTSEKGIKGKAVLIS